jgi:hypothetical protein
VVSSLLASLAELGEGVQGERLAPLVIDHQIRRHAEEPGSWLLVRADLAELLPGTDERLLAEVIGNLLVAGDAPDVTDDVALVALKERLEGAIVTPRRSRPSV